MRHLVLFTMALAVLPAQEPKESTKTWLTSQMMNGRAWVDLNQKAKVDYLSGFRDALIGDFLMNFRPVSTLSEKWAEGFVINDYVAELDKVYEQGENLLLPIPVAMNYCTEKLKGQSTHLQLEQKLMLFRKLYRQ